VIFGRVVGTVVATTRSDQVAGGRYLLVQVANARGEPRTEYLVAVDAVGAGAGELVMVTQGPSARQTGSTDRKAVDALINGIVDLVDEQGKVVFRK